MVVVNHRGVHTDTLHHAIVATSLLVAVLIVKLFDDLEKIIVDLRLVTFCDLLLLLFVDVDLGSENCFATRLPRDCTCTCGSSC